MRLEYDIKKLFMDAFAPQPGEVVTFVTDFPADAAQASEETKHRREMTETWHSAMCELADHLGFTVRPVLVIDLRNPAPVPAFDADGSMDGQPVDLAAVMDSWREKDIIIAITGPSITAELVRRLGQNFRFGSAPGVTADFEGFKADYSKIPLRFEILVSRMAKAVAAHFTFRLEGMVWKCSLDLRGQRYQFCENGSAHRPGEFINLPSGCANIPPYAGIAGDPRGPSRSCGEIPALIDDELVVYRIEGNRIIEIIGSGDAAADERQHVLGGDPAMAVVTKLGLGVNDQARCNGSHVGDEKTMGMHWGYGPKKHFPDTIWAEHPVQMDMDFEYYDGRFEPIFRDSMYTVNLGELF
ncbi:hypothetical protein JXA80_02005 [bacterium]|nr:hypothetical protein [candidate division CSSED10-310 bacterium]